jgi:hypothetical protein
MIENRPLPWFYLVNDKPVKMVQTPDGGMDVLVYDFDTGDFVRDFDYLPICLEHTTDIDSIDEEAFNSYVQHLQSLKTRIIG